MFCHKDGTKQKAQNYMTLVPVGNRLFIGVIWEMLVLNPKKHSADQWKVPEDHCQITALHLRTVKQCDLEAGSDEVSGLWRPEVEMP